jgi:hypothetical protein
MYLRDAPLQPLQLSSSPLPSATTLLGLGILFVMVMITATLFASLEAMREGWGPLAAALVTTGQLGAHRRYASG